MHTLWVDKVQRCSNVFSRTKKGYFSSCGFRSVAFNLSLTHLCFVCVLYSHIMLDSVWCTWYIRANACKWWSFNICCHECVCCCQKKWVCLSWPWLCLIFLHTWLEKLCSCAKLEIRLAYFIMLLLFFSLTNSLLDHGQDDVFEKELIFWHIWRS